MGLIIKQHFRHRDETCAICNEEVDPSPFAIYREIDSSIVCTSCARKESPELEQIVHHYHSRINYKTRSELLAHYGERVPNLFIQFDGVYDWPPEYNMPADKDVYTLTSNLTWELMYGALIRILIKPCLVITNT
jgi:hypothetical protein